MDIAAVLATLTRHLPLEILFMSLRVEAVHPPKLLAIGRDVKAVVGRFETYGLRAGVLAGIRGICC